MLRRSRNPDWAGWRLFPFALIATAGLLAPAHAQEGELKKKAESGQNIELRAHRINLRINEHAVADANGDGSVSRSERTGFLAALAMQATRATLKEFPEADGDEDGGLTVTEAIELVQGRKARAELRGQRKPEGEGSAAERAERRQANIALWTRILDTQDWLLDNMTSEPSAEKVGKLSEAIKAAERAEFLRKNPDADADGDGILTAEEREAYNQSRWSKRLAETREQIAEIEAALKQDLKPGHLKKLQERLKRLRGMEAELSGAIERREQRP